VKANILGISCYYHDAAAALIQDGKIVAAAQEERFSRIRHDQDYPAKAIDYCLREAGLSPGDLTHIVFYDKPWLKFERILETYLAFAPRGLSSFLMAMPMWLKEKLRTDQLIRKHAADNKQSFAGELLFMRHHDSHAASAFFPSPFEEAAILTLDGVGEWATTSWGIGRGNRIELFKEMRFPHSLGLLYSAFTYYTGFKVNSGEYKLMGLAPYGAPKYVSTIYDHLVSLKEDGSFCLNLEMFDYCVGLTMTNGKFHRLFGGPPRTPETKLTQKMMDIAASIQEVTEEIVLRMGRHVRQETGLTDLCLAGGVALNCVANGKLLRSGTFDRLWIQPAAGDAGGALGAALYGWHQHLDQPRQSGRRDSQRGSCLGVSYSSGEIRDWLKQRNIPAREVSPADLPREVAGLIAAEKVTGLFQGRMEFGPRALGARSIIGDARSRTMQSTMNLKIKYRESFRPFAPAVLEEKAAEWFELDRESPYMLLVAPVRAERRLPEDEAGRRLEGIEKINMTRSTIPAVTHVDYSARVQTVSREDHPIFHKIIEEFDRLTGCPVIINTSFNVRGEPIVCSPEDAYRCFMRTNMDYLVLENFILAKDEQQALAEESDWRQIYALD
jgi:carbamoyltransferase